MFLTTIKDQMGKRDTTHSDTNLCNGKQCPHEAVTVAHRWKNTSRRPTKAYTSSIKRHVANSDTTHSLNAKHFEKRTDIHMTHLHTDGKHTAQKDTTIKLSTRCPANMSMFHVPKTIPRSPPTSHRNLAWLLDAKRNS